MKIKTFEEILEDLLAKTAARTRLTNFNPGSVIRTLLEIIAAAIAELYGFVATALKQAFLATATGYWLDLKAREYGLSRKTALFTYGEVFFGRNEAKNVNISIPAGTIVATLKDQSGNEYRYTTTDAVVLAAGEIEVTAQVKAEFAGSDWNVGAGSIQKLTVYISGIEFVRNDVDWITSEGTDQETDDELRRRCFLAWEELARGGTKAAYESWALSVNGVKNVYVNDNFPRGQGTVDIFILSSAGIPTPALLQSTQEVIEQNKPICSNALALEPVVRAVAIDMVITPARYADTAAIEAEVRKRIEAYFNPSGNPDYVWIEPLGIGKAVIKAQLTEVVMSVEGVYNVAFNNPVADIPLGPEEFPVATIVNITFAPIAEAA